MRLLGLVCEVEKIRKMKLSWLILKFYLRGFLFFWGGGGLRIATNIGGLGLMRLG